MFVSETYSLEDCSFYSVDATGLGGTHTTGTDGTYTYITGCDSTTGLSSFTFPTDFTITYKAYTPTSSSTDTNYNGLWSIGSNANNGVLIGTEISNKRIRLYNRNNGNNTSIEQKNNAYSGNWFDVKISYNSGVWKIECGTQSITYSKTFTPQFIHLFGNYASVRFTDFKIKAL